MFEAEAMLEIAAMGRDGRLFLLAFDIYIALNHHGISHWVDNKVVSSGWLHTLSEGDPPIPKYPAVMNPCVRVCDAKVSIGKCVNACSRYQLGNW